MLPANVVKAHFKQMMVVSASFDAIPRFAPILVTTLMISSFNARFCFALLPRRLILRFDSIFVFFFNNYSTNSIDFYNKRGRGGGGSVCVCL